MRKIFVGLLSLFFLFLVSVHSEKEKEDHLLIKVKPAKLTPLKKETFAWLEANRGELAEINEKIWRLAEVAMEEYESSELLASYLEKRGFQVTRGVAGMPTAFVAVYGSGKPVIGIETWKDIKGIHYDSNPHEAIEAVSRLLIFSSTLGMAGTFYSLTLERTLHDREARLSLFSFLKCQCIG